MRLAAISDLHGNLIPIKKCEVLCICGDIVPLDIQRNVQRSSVWITKHFAKYIISLPCEKVFIVAGNHDFAFEKNLELGKELNKFTFGKAVVLKNETVTYVSEKGKTYTIFGSPFCKRFHDWAFNRDSDVLYKAYNLMPENCDIMLTHDAPYGVSDQVAGNHCGNPELKKVVEAKQPGILLHGHLHESNHDVEYINKTMVYNVSVLNEMYRIKFKPLYLEI
jgi:Icc-related predicted phosphoesterase